MVRFYVLFVKSSLGKLPEGKGGPFMLKSFLLPLKRAIDRYFWSKTQKVMHQNVSYHMIIDCLREMELVTSSTSCGWDLPLPIQCRE